MVRFFRDASLASPSAGVTPGPCLVLDSASLAEQPTQPLYRSLLQVPALSKKVIVVDDSPTVRAILALGLLREGFEVETFEDGISFFRWLALHKASCPDLVILDVMLPKLDGYTIAQRLKANPLFKETVVLFLSSKDGVFDRLRGRLVGASGYLTKPFRMQDVITMISGALGSFPSHEPTPML